MPGQRLEQVLEIKSSGIFVRRYLGVIALLTGIIIALLFWGFHYNASQNAMRQLYQHGKSFFEEIVVVRSWIARHGGVYVPMELSSGPNPYLEKMPGVKAQLACGDQLFVLKNPALITRELSESALHGDRVRYKITSLKYLNPRNEPDAFERESLQLFERGQRENTTLATMDGKLYYRYMAPLLVEKSCLKCHDQQGYREGDIRGGIAVSVLAEEVSQKLARSRLYTVASGIGVVLLVGLSILFISRYFVRDLQRAQDLLISMAMTDFLTGLYNRMTGMRLLKQELARSQRREQSLSLAVIDLDHFKQINDTHGHNVGDEVLVAVARLLRETVREYDLCCRYGGEEFLLIMPATSLEHALGIVRRLQAGLDEGPLVVGRGEKIRLTLSAGVATHAPGEELDAFIGRVDALLYQAKEQGRNQVCG